MPAFLYVALGPKGRKQKSVIEADSSRSASLQLKQKGLIPLEIVQQQTSEAKNTGIFNSSRSIGNTQLAIFTRQLATLITAGLPIEECLGAIAAQSDRALTRNQIAALRSSVREGHSLADSMRQNPKSFSSLYCATVAAGERSGHLDLVLQRLADYTESQMEFRQKIQLALIYPILLVTLSILIVLGLMVYVVPDVVDVITTAGEELPLLTQLLIASSNFTMQWGLLVIAFLLGLTLLFPVVFRDQKRRLRLHKIYLRTPMIRSYSCSSNAIRYVCTLAILVQSGVPLVDAMKVASEVVTNTYFQQHLFDALEKVKAGGSLNRALGDTGAFPPMMIHLIASGEATGELGSMLARASSSQESDLQRKVATVVSLFEPATLIIMGVIVLSIVLAILMPILNLNQLIQ